MCTVEIECDWEGRHAESCLALARNLPEGFTDSAIEAMAEDLRDQTCYVALDCGRDDASVDEKKVVGFVSVDPRGPHVAELGWFAVEKRRQGAGIGMSLVDAVTRDVAGSGVKLLTVKTLADTVEDENYARTRRFYENVGFLHVETIDPFPGWDPGNPCAIYVKPLCSDQDPAPG